MSNYKLKILSLGAGVQSSTLLLMACKGIIEKPNLAIFADTGWESQATYMHTRQYRQLNK
jgi:3'-phosphoadenosine 5'-phosphosulfate sulfotransferase (PAPS reductase)/FAD synthetase